MATQIIGKVTATEKNPTSCNSVTFWVQEDVIIRPFDIVKIEHLSPGNGKGASTTYAIVQDLQYITDSGGHLANYVSSDFGDVNIKPQNQRIGTTIAEAEILSNDAGIEMPIRDGAQVHWADAAGIRDALGIEGQKAPIPAGFIQMSNGEEIPVDLDGAYLLGPEGAHLNMAGISGLATKTSYTMFLLKAIQQRMNKKVCLVIFNVKGSDLLRIDEPNPTLTEEDKANWKKCNLDPEPFKDVTYLYPYAKRPTSCYTNSQGKTEVIAQQQKDKKAFNYYYDVDEMKKRFDLLFSDIEDPSGSMDSIIQALEGAKAEEWDEFREEVQKLGQPGQKGEIAVQSWRRFKRLLKTRTERQDLFTDKSFAGAGAGKASKCQKTVNEAIRGLKGGKVLVIDIAPLPDYVQCLVVGDAIRTIYGIMLGEDEDTTSDALGKVVVFADELNKYAPKASGNGRSLTGSLLEITERGRSLGVVMFGAEQFRSGVHDRVLGNCSTNVYGRTSPVEIERCPDYKYFPKSHKAAIIRLSKGQLLLQHAIFKTHLVKVKFPQPCYLQPKAD